MKYRQYTCDSPTEMRTTIEEHVPKVLHFEELLGSETAEVVTKVVSGYTEFTAMMSTSRHTDFFFILFEFPFDFKAMKVYTERNDVRLTGMRKYICVVMQYSEFIKRNLYTLYIGEGNDIIRHLGMSLDRARLRDLVKEYEASRTNKDINDSQTNE